MQKKAFLWLILGLGAFGLNAQIFQTNYIRKNMRIHTDTCVIDIIIIEEDINIHAKPNRTYYWYKNRQIYTNQGGVGGNVLDGCYKVFSKKDRLLEEGKFKKGLKTGTWKNWDTEGNIKQLQHFKKGQIHGKTTLFKTNGETIIIKYKHGEPKVKKIPFFMWWKKENGIDSVEVADTITTQPVVLNKASNQTNTTAEAELKESVPADTQEIIEPEPTDAKKETEVKPRRRRQANEDNNNEGKVE